MAKKRLFAMPLSDKATDIYCRLTDLDRGDSDGIFGFRQEMC